ncbi:MAG: hypothetical protein ABSF89_11265 [Acidimicrobiales bacterium]
MRRPRLRLSVVSAAIAVGFAGLVALLYGTSVHTGAADSDKATTMLVGQAMSNGHLLLHGWILAPGSYWTSDALFYALAVRVVGGLRPGILYAEPAIVTAVTISVGVLLAVEGRRAAAGLAGAVAVVALLAFATPAMDYWFVGKGFHVATALYALVAFAALRRGHFGWGWAAGVALLAFGMLGDLMIVAFAAAPLLTAGLAAMLRERRWQSGIAQVTAAVASGGIGEIALRLADTFGKFEPGTTLRIADLGQMVTNVGHLFTYGAHLVGWTNGPFATRGVPLGLLEVHAVGALCMLTCLSAALVSLVAGVIRGRSRNAPPATGTELWRLDDMLVFATLGSSAIFVILAGANGIGVHFLVVPIVFASVLTGRIVARAWSKVPVGWTARALAIAGLAVSLSFGAGLGYALSRPEPTQPASSLATWLVAHDLTNGIGGYWSAAITTVESNGAVTVRPVSIGRHGVQRMMSQSSASWYAGQRFQFLVYGTSRHADRYMIAADRTWGPPPHLYEVGRYHVLVWDHTLRIAPFPQT